MCEIPGQEGTNRHGDLRQHADENNEPDRERDQEAFPSMDLDLLRRAHGRHHIILLVDVKLLEKEDRKGNHDHHDRQRGCHISVAAGLVQVFIVDQVCKNAVPFPDHLRCAEIPESGHENHQRTGCNGRHDDRQGNGQDRAWWFHD